MMADTLAIPEQVSEVELSRVIDVVLGERGIRSVNDLVAWYEKGRRDKLAKVDEAARELGVRPSTLRTIISSSAFRAAYFKRILMDRFNPDVLSRGMTLLAADMLSEETSPKDRLAILRAISEMMGVKPTQKVEHEITQKSVEVKFVIETSPSDFVDGEESGRVLGTVQPLPAQGELGHALPEAAGVVLEADFAEAEEGIVGEEVR